MNKLILLFSSMFILVVVSLTVISYQILQQESIQHSLSSTSNNLKLINQKLEEYVQEMEHLSLPQINYDELTTAILNESTEYSARMYIEDYLRQLFSKRDDLEGIYFYIVNSNKYYQITKVNNDTHIQTFYNDQIPRLTWYKDALVSPQNRAYQSLIYRAEMASYRQLNQDDFFAYHRILRSIVTREPLAALSFYYNGNVKDTILKDVPFEEGEQIIWLSPLNEVFLTSDLTVYRDFVNDDVISQLSNVKQGQYTWHNNDMRYSVIYNIGDREGWKLIKLTPYATINAIATKTANFNLLLGSIFLIIAIAFVIIFSNQITKPLKRLSFQMKKLGTGDFNSSIEVVGKDELAYISNHFNEMVNRINQLINERYKLKLAEQNAILKALEAQINPHFLYNALQAVSTKALKSGQDDIVDMVDALALSLRYCISGEDIVSAEEELKHIEHYLVIQKERFGDRLEVVYEWDKQLLSLQVPKLSIQTLVENAIKHGVERVSAPVVLRIRAELVDDNVVITVANNGPKIDVLRLRDIRQSLDQDYEHALHKNDHIGLINLQTRLKILYGSEAGLHIESNDEETKMQIVLPEEGESQDEV